MGRKRIVGAALALMTVGGLPVARAVCVAAPTADFVVLAGPLAGSTGFATRTVVITAGSTLTFTNADTAQHNVVSAIRDVDGVPIFASPYVDTGASEPVEGVDALAPGSYEFFCTVHPNMTGSLEVQ